MDDVMDDARTVMPPSKFKSDAVVCRLSGRHRSSVAVWKDGALARPVGRWVIGY